MSPKANQQITVGGVLKKWNKVLLLQRSAKEKVLPNLWELPSGKKMGAETITQALVREFKEETGLRVKPVAVVSIFTYKVVKKNLVTKTIQTNFLVSCLSRDIKIKLSPEHRAYKWVDKKNLKKAKVSQEISKTLYSIL